MNKQLLLPLPMEFIRAVEIVKDFAPCPADMVVENTADTLVGLGAGVLTFIFAAGIPVWFPAYKNNGKARPGVPEPVRFKCKVALTGECVANWARRAVRSKIIVPTLMPISTSHCPCLIIGVMFGIHRPPLSERQLQAFMA